MHFGLPKPENLLREVEDDILEDIYRDIDKINAKIKYAQIKEVGGLEIHAKDSMFEENPESAKTTIVKQKAEETKEEAVLLQRFKYDFVDRELVQYMRELLMLFTTEDA